MITPAISVLSAVEGLDVALPGLSPLIWPIALVILVGLFLVQRGGTARLGAWFGPISLVVVRRDRGVPACPGSCASRRSSRAINPVHAWTLLREGGGPGFFILGSVVLCVTGAEALYADLGHFGRKPIALAWYTVVFPSLLLSYFGQGAFLLHAGAEGIDNPFFAMLPGWSVLPMVGLATLATIVASQAVISGSYSLTAQAIQLGYLPRMQIIHTSSRQEGQIYVPAVNWALMIACIFLVLEFRGSSGLASAYGIAVTGTMAVTTFLFVPIASAPLRLARRASRSCTRFLVIDLTLFGANLPKTPHGGAFPLAMGLVLFTIMTTWKRGTDLLNTHLNDVTLPLTAFIADVANSKAAARARHGGVHVGLPRRPAARARPPLQTLEGVARADRAAVDHHRARAGGAAPGPRAGRVPGRGLRARDRALRLHPDALDHRRACARSRPPACPSGGGGELLPRPRHRARLRQARARGLAQAAVRVLHYTAQPAAGYFGIPPGRAVELGMQITI